MEMVLPSVEAITTIIFDVVGNVLVDMEAGAIRPQVEQIEYDLRGFEATL
jgi:hypothetical protein